MNCIYAPNPLEPEILAAKWASKQVRAQIVKNKIVKAVKNNRIEEAQEYAKELEKIENEPLFQWPEYIIIR